MYEEKIDMYEEMAIVVGKDLAQGNFSKTFADIDVDASIESGQPSMTIDSVPSKRVRLRVVPHRAQGHIERGLELTKDRKWNTFQHNFKKWLVLPKKFQTINVMWRSFMTIL
uniref:Uncharacterized protein n=1 Tax=Chenopodium quinoa TaxID=63459 RepID=A0A803N8M5_CHEQI